MTEESMAWLGAALTLVSYGASPEQAAELAGPYLEAIGQLQRVEEEGQ